MKTLRVWPLLAVFGLLASALPLLAQVPGGYVRVSSGMVSGEGGLQDANQSLVANATISFCPVNNQGVPISFNLANEGQATDRCVTAQVTDGVFSLLVAEGAQTNPANPCFAVTVTDNLSGQSILGPGYNCVQPSGSPTGPAVAGPNAWCTAFSIGFYGASCNFDHYVPNLAALVVQQPGTQGATGPQGPPGVINLRGPWAASTAYAKADAFTQGTDLYIVITAYTSGSSFGSTDSANVAQLATGCPITGCSFTGAVAVAGNPSTDLGVVPKQYADAILSTATGSSVQTTGSVSQTVTQAINTNLAIAGSGNGTFDLSSMPFFKAPVSAGFAATAAGHLGYDSTNLNWHVWNGADAIVPVFPSATPPTSGHPLGALKTGNTWTLEDLGAPPSLSTLGGLAAANNLSDVASKSAALAALLPGTTQNGGTGTSNEIDHPGNMALGGMACPAGILSATECFAGAAFYDATIGAGSNQLPPASTFASLPWNPQYFIVDGANSCDATVGGGIFTVPVFSDGASWHAMVSCTGGSGVTPPSGQVATVAERDLLSSTISVKSVRPGSTGVVPTSKKILPDCATGWNGSALTPTNANSGELGDRYCDSADQTAGEVSGPTESVPTYTASGAGTCPSSTCPISTNLGGGSGSPSAVTAEYGLTSYDSVCDTSPPALPVAGLAAAPCVSASGALFSQTTPSATADESTSTLFPTHWSTTSTICNADHFYEDVYFYIPTFTGNKRLEFDKNVECGGNYYSIGMSYNFSTNRFDFLPGNGGGFGGHTSGASGCASSWCPMYYSPVGGGSTLTTLALAAGHWIHLRGFYHRVSNLATKGTQSSPNFFYDELDIADLGSSGTGADTFSRYNLVDPNYSNKSPSGWSGSAGSPAFDLQWQLYSNAVSTTTSVEVENDTFISYSLVAGSNGGSFSEQQTDLGELDFDSSTLTTDSDTTPADGSTIAQTGSPTFITTNEESGAGAMQCAYQSGGCFQKVTFSGPQNTIYTRFYINPTTLTTDTCSSGCASKIFQLNNGSGTVFHIYVNDAAGTLTAFNDAWTSGAGAQTCTITTSAITTASGGAWPFLDLMWTEGASSSTGAWTVLWNGAAPADGNCSQTNVNTGYSGSFVGATYAELGYIVDGGTNHNWVWGFDNWGINDGAESLYNGYIGPVTLSANIETYQPYISGCGTDSANGIACSGDGTFAGVNQNAAGNYANTCSMSSGTTCMIPISGTFNSSPLCFANPQSGTYTGGMAKCVLSGSTVTVTAPTSNSLTWGALLIGNPN